VRIHAKRDCGDISSTRPIRQPARLPGVEHIARKNRNRHARQDARRDQRRRKSAQWSEASNQQQVGKSAEEKSKRALDIPSDKPSRCAK
jgi:hypothetical protein